MRKLAAILFTLGLLAAVFASHVSSASFDDSTPCPAQGPLLVCPHAKVGVPYSLQIPGRAGCDRYWFEILGGQMPAGLTFARSGLVSGTPAQAETQQPWVQIHDLLPSEGGFDWCGGDNRSQRQFVFTVDAGPPPPPPAPKLWYWDLKATTRLHAERAVTYRDGSTGLGKMLTWEQAHKDTIRAAGTVTLVHEQR